MSWRGVKDGGEGQNDSGTLGGFDAARMLGIESCVRVVAERGRRGGREGRREGEEGRGAYGDAGVRERGSEEA